MNESYGVLAQSKPAAGVLVDLYEVPPDTQAVISSVHACNQDTVADPFRCAIAVAGVADSPEQYLHWDTPGRPRNPFEIVGGITLNAGDVIRVRAANGDTSFNVFGVEVTA